MATESSRMWASASFVGVLIIIGLPLWWKTTEVYRVSLPYGKIAAFDSRSHTVATEVTVMANDDATASEIAGLIEKSFEDSPTLKIKVTKTILSDSLRNTLESVADDPEAIEEITANVDVNKPNTLYIVQRTPLFQQVWLSTERVMFFRDSTAGPTVVEALKNWVYQTSVLQAAFSESDEARRTRFPPGGGYHVTLSLAVPSPKTKLRFPAREAMEDYIGTFVDELSELHNFTLKSQWLYLLDFDFKAKEIKDSSEYGRHFAVRQDRLHLLLTKIEERAATHVSQLPTINLVLYAVPCERAPLVIYDDDTRVPTPVQAFMSPKWGGVVLANPKPEECGGEGEVQPNVPRVMGAFVAQLRPLLGIPDMAHIPDAQLDPLRSVTPRRWEVDALLRLRVVEQITSAEKTLQSLAQLLGKISNIVINDEVGASINGAVDGIGLAREQLARGDLMEAYNSSRGAHQAAETAFMEPSLLALLYFPDDQKYAIYIPLFLPVMFPVVLSLKTLLLWLRGKPLHKEKAD
ncbi:GPI transamidase component PIG-S isoform X2 [Leguminivora glycinivorella]|uniref:GPI transamidase component PIG-S isoform X2 n=1 Tax=Leguminivora glycinivorella TaxID=1035111 RepID=UPI00200F03C0|nr:GPI transamidase component PIG-S isoform X2 [Leguminivora glycinivorella]